MTVFTMFRTGLHHSHEVEYEADCTSRHTLVSWVQLPTRCTTAKSGSFGPKTIDYIHYTGHISPSAEREYRLELGRNLLFPNFLPKYSNFFPFSQKCELNHKISLLTEMLFSKHFRKTIFVNLYY